MTQKNQTPSKKYDEMYILLAEAEHLISQGAKLLRKAIGAQGNIPKGREREKEITQGSLNLVVGRQVDNLQELKDRVEV